MDIWANEIGVLYRSFVEGREPRLAELPLQYADYARWQRERVDSEPQRRQLDYWTRRLAGAPPLDLPTVHERPPVQSQRGATYPVRDSRGGRRGVLGRARRRGSDAVRRGAGGVQRAAAPLFRADRPDGRHADLRPQPRRARGAARVLPQHRGGENGDLGRSVLPRSVEAREGRDARGVFASGCAVRSSGPGPAAGSRSQPRDVVLGVAHRAARAAGLGPSRPRRRVRRALHRHARSSISRCS